MAGLVPLPQTVNHSSTRLTHLEAHNLLSSFLTEAETNPAYRPDATLTQSGPQALGVGAGSNLTLNHLNRILQGIAGKRIGGVEFNYGQGPPKKRKVDDESSRSGRKGYAPGAEVIEMADGDEQGQAAILGRETGDWQDKEDYEHAQVDETADLDGRDPADPGAEESAALVPAEPVLNDDVAIDTASIAGGKSQTDKEKRKQAKQAKRKKERVEKNEAIKDQSKTKG